MSFRTLTAVSVFFTGFALSCGGGDGGSTGPEPDPVVIRADVAITGMSVTPDVVTAGAATQIVYAINLINNGPDAATSVSVASPLPANVTFVSSTGGGAFSSGMVTWNLGNLPSGVVASRSATVTVDPERAAGPMAISATVSTPTIDPQGGNNGGSTSTAILAAIDNQASADVDGLGGVVSTPSGNALVAIPSGAVEAGDISVSLEEKHASHFPDEAGRLSNVIEFGPDGAQFDVPVTISIELPPEAAGSASSLWGFNEATTQWEEVPLSHTVNGRVWGEVSHFSAYSAAAAGTPGACTVRPAIPLRMVDNLSIPMGTRDQVFVAAPGTAFAQELSSRWIVDATPFTVTGAAGPPEGMGKWIDYATPAPHETGDFTIAADGSFNLQMDIPELGFRFLAFTDACLSGQAVPGSGWYYHMEVWCGEGCEQTGGGGGGVPAGCNFPSTVAMVPNNDWIEAAFGFLENAACAVVGANPPFSRVIYFRSFPSGDRTATVIFGLHRWEILSSSHGSTNAPASFWWGLPDATNITFDLRDAFDPQGPTYRLVFRFDGGSFSVVSFVEL